MCGILPEPLPLKTLRRIALALLAVLCIAVIGLAVLAFDILRHAEIGTPEPADVALVLGAAVSGDQPSPVYRERIRHAVALYQAGTVQALIFSGGLGPGDALTEAEAGRDWAVAHGVPADAILLESEARTTRQNIVLSLPLIAAHGFGSVLLVSDPLHMRRALWMARDAGLDVRPAPTPTSRYVSFGSQAGFLARELWFNLWYALTGQ